MENTFTVIDKIKKVCYNKLVGINESGAELKKFRMLLGISIILAAVLFLLNMVSLYNLYADNQNKADVKAILNETIAYLNNLSEPEFNRTLLNSMTYNPKYDAFVASIAVDAQLLSFATHLEKDYNYALRLFYSNIKKLTGEKSDKKEEYLNRLNFYAELKGPLDEKWYKVFNR